MVHNISYKKKGKTNYYKNFVSKEIYFITGSEKRIKGSVQKHPYDIWLIFECAKISII